VQNKETLLFYLYFLLTLMEETIFSEKIAAWLYTERAIRLATFLGGPLVAGYLIATNYKELGEPEKVKPTWLIAFAATVVIIVIAFLLPARTPPYIIPFAYTFGTYYLVQNLQGKKIKAHVAAGGQLQPVWKAVVAGLIGLLLIVALVFIAFFMMDRYVSA